MASRALLEDEARQELTRRILARRMTPEAMKARALAFARSMAPAAPAAQEDGKKGGPG